MKKVWQVFIVFCMWATSVEAEMLNSLYADRWVDSIYQKLTVDERIGQLIDLRVSPQAENVQELTDVITRYHIGSITITGGSVMASVQLINNLRTNLKVPIYVTAENTGSFGMPFDSSGKLPLPSTFLAANDSKLLAATIAELSAIHHQLGINGAFYTPMEVEYEEEGLNYVSKVEGGKLMFGDLLKLYHQNNIVPNTNFHFNFSNDLAFSSKLPESWNLNTWQEKMNAVLSEMKDKNYAQSIVTIKSLPDFPEGEAFYFYKKVVNPLFNKQLEFRGILSSDFDAINETQSSKNDKATIRTLLKIGSDKIVISSRPDMAYSAILFGLEKRFFRQNEIKEKVKRLLRLKYQSGLSRPKVVGVEYLTSKLDNPELRQLSYQVYSKALTPVKKETSACLFRT